MVKTWREELVIARERQDHGAKPFTPEVVDRAARSWVTCAVGEQHRLHPEVVHYMQRPRSIHPAPVDALLEFWGGEGSEEYAGFGAAVENQDVDAAERALAAIEDRVLAMKRGF
jgi:hypothetical protein